MLADQRWSAGLWLLHAAPLHPSWPSTTAGPTLLNRWCGTHSGKNTPFARVLPHGNPDECDGTMKASMWQVHCNAIGGHYLGDTMTHGAPYHNRIMV